MLYVGVKIDVVQKGKNIGWGGGVFENRVQGRCLWGKHLYFKDFFLWGYYLFRELQ